MRNVFRIVGIALASSALVAQGKPASVTPPGGRCGIRLELGPPSNPGSFGTRCHQMAKMVVYEAAPQTLSDSPTKYERNAEPFAFMSSVPATWQTTVGLGGTPGTYVCLARQAEDGTWYAAAINGNDARDLKGRDRR